MGDNIKEKDCAVCLQKCHHPTQLPCGHIFCFLCVKGVAIQSKRCAMCRAEIPPDYLDHPVLLENLSPQPGNTQEPLMENQWYYEGRNGWWKYDERSNIELETAFNNGSQECMLLLAGALYCIDFQNMTQIRRSDPTRRRRVRRDTPLFPAKGIAGIKVNESQPIEQVKQENDNNSATNIQNVIQIDDDDDTNEAEDNDDEVVIVHPTTPITIDLDDVSDEFDRLNIVNIQESES